MRFFLPEGVGVDASEASVISPEHGMATLSSTFYCVRQPISTLLLSLPPESQKVVGEQVRHVITLAMLTAAHWNMADSLFKSRCFALRKE